MHTLNNYRRAKNVPKIPSHLPSVEYRVLVPLYQASIPQKEPISSYTSRRAKYQDNIRLMIVELEVIDWITNGYLPDMSKTQRQQLDRNLLAINEVRIKKRKMI